MKPAKFPTYDRAKHGPDVFGWIVRTAAEIHATRERERLEADLRRPAFPDRPGNKH